mmetsp:Transcript_23937/g.38179  ORF Transcript_23937/g.38179 Transcript_23937/m.38179 type:complete len:438 (-) Transcript_23937:4848-6161(-)|eukprot:CAMPEP_0203765094 /NCGR_PEP_ID=MMETSP0098-20131031/18226_1 /ASSEMBLY_ACC=CAM_ASM_000208 /TAXON_ID=96639 /ORGANISM=" , Strain NY0313808BC1" /LENGTH=437 /DNA_ID=CAMNT_0050661317 /DNA_START=3067 /DNA_END=4380 /DNA_ORIENTATION=-
MAHVSPSLLLRQAKTDEQLAQEVLAGGLNPDLHSAGRAVELVEEDENESDEVFLQIRVLLTSALSSGQIRSLARAVVLAWQAGYDSALLRQAEPKLVKKAKELKLRTDIEMAMQARSHPQLQDCLQRAAELGLTESNFPELGPAIAMDKELEEETAKVISVSRPGHTKMMSSVIGELSSQMFGMDIQQLQEIVEKDAVAAKEAVGHNHTRLQESLAELEELRDQPTSSVKLSKLRDLKLVFSEINPKNLENRVTALANQIEDLRVDNAELMIALRTQGTEVVALSSATGGDADISAMHGQMAQLQERIVELEENEDVLRGRVDQAAKLGAKWMEEKKDKEIEELIERHQSELGNARDSFRQEQAEEFKRRSQDISKQEKKAKVVALKGLEDALNKKHQADVQALKAQHKTELANVKATLEAADKKIKQLEKIIKMRG